MKKIITLSVFTLLYAASNLFAVDKLYIVGDALFCGWNGGEAPLMYVKGNDVFTFTGYFEADKEFKFMQDKDWNGQYYNGSGATAYLDLDEGGKLTTDGDVDAKFMMQTSGYYKITCDLQKMTIKAETKNSNDEQPIRYQALFMVGSATLTGWDLDKSLRLENQGERLYSGDFYLYADETFKLSFAPKQGFINDYFFFRDEQDAAKVSRDGTNDRQWSVSETGLYAVTVNLEDNSISYTKKDIDRVYIVGEAVFSGWLTDDSPMMNVESSNVFSYTGWFKQDEEFKLILERALNDNGIQIQNGAGETAYIENGSGTLKFTVARMEDSKFKLEESGNYKLTCDLNTMAITAEKIAYQETEIHYSALYLVGTATPDNEVAEDFPTKAVKLDSNGDNTYSAANIDLNAGVFKILTANDRGWWTTHYFRDADDATKISEDGTEDRKWEITEAGKYNITVNMSDMTISIVKLFSTNKPSDIFINTEVYTSNADIYVNNAVGSVLRLYSTQGQLLNEVKIAENSQSFTLNLNQGIYIAILSIGNNTKSYKLHIR